MNRKNIIITGPESVGKSSLAEALAARFGGIRIPEYARDYIGDLGRPYTMEDVLLIARKQVQQYRDDYGSAEWVFFDTWLIITKVWLEVVFGSSPPWITEELKSAKADLVLLCYPDLPWEPDDVRENGGEMRMNLFEEYRKNLELYGLQYEIVKGENETRVNNAIRIITRNLPVR